MTLIMRLYVLVVGLSLMGTATALVTPKSDPLASAVGERIVRTHQGGRGFYTMTNTALGTDISAQLDQKTSALRFASGGSFADVAVLSDTATLRDYTDEIERFIASHQDALEVGMSALKLDHDALLVDADVAFFKYRVYRNNVLIRDANIDFRFNQGKLQQILNRSFGEAAADPVQHDALDLGAIKSAWKLEAITWSHDYYRVLEQAEGYRLRHVAVYNIVSAEHLPYELEIETQTGNIYAVRPRHFYANGRAEAEVHPRYYKDATQFAALQQLSVKVGGKTSATDTNGDFVSPTDTPPKASFAGSYIKVTSADRKNVDLVGELINDAWKLRFLKNVNSPAASDPSMAQAMAYHHAMAVRDYTKGFINSNWLESRVTAKVNHSFDYCNAFWDGKSINFMSGGKGCANTALVADIIYHEWGHGLDQNTGGIEDGALSEGFGDIVSLLMTNSPVIGIGFKEDGGVVRDLRQNHKYPDDKGEVHKEGMIIGSTFYTLYTELMQKHGESAAGELLSKYAFKGIVAASRYTEFYDALLLIDDVDGDLRNGTPNFCSINRAFSSHGLATSDANCG